MLSACMCKYLLILYTEPKAVLNNPNASVFFFFLILLRIVTVKTCLQKIMVCNKKNEAVEGLCAVPYRTHRAVPVSLPEYTSIKVFIRYK